MIKRSALTLMFSAAMVFGVATAGSAQETGEVDDDCKASPLVCPVDVVEPVEVLPSAPEPVVAAPTTVVTPRQTLPVTGAETAALALGGLVLVSAGGALVWRSNKATA
jgi:LPXTG-motif cell wall-anchored protein